MGLFFLNYAVIAILSDTKGWKWCLTENKRAISISESTFPPRIKAPQSWIMSANLTANHPNISVWVIPEQRGITQVN